MGDATFEATVAGRGWILGTDPRSELMPGWAGLFSEAVDEAGVLFATCPEAAIR